MHQYRALISRIVDVRTLCVVITVICAFSTGCVSSAYMKDRMTDGADIFTATVGKGLGAKARIGPVQAGLVGVVDKAGLRGGRLHKFEEFEYAGADFCLIFFGLDDFCFQGSTMGPRNKEYATIYCLVPLDWPFKGGPQLNASYWTQIDVVFGVGIMLRFGFNPGELLDFALGWFGIDIYSDDIEMMSMKSESNSL